MMMMKAEASNLDSLELKAERTLLGAKSFDRCLLLYQRLSESVKSVLQLLLTRRIHRLGRQLTSPTHTHTEMT